jgi:hypothetical protein
VQTDASFLQQLTWDRSAPAELVTAANKGQPVPFARAWKRRLRARLARGRAATPRELLAGWSMALTQDEPLLRLVRGLAHPPHSSRRQRAAIKSRTSWSVRVQPLAKALAASPELLDTPFGLLCALELLATATFSLPHKVWWPLWCAALQAVLRRDFALKPAADNPDVALLEQGELPLLAGLVFPDVVHTAGLVVRGRRALKADLIARTDTDGTPHSELIPRLSLWLAVLVRSTLWSRQWGLRLWSDGQRQRLSDCAERAVALCRGDGKLALTNGLPAPPLPVLSRAAELFEWTPRNPSLASLKRLRRQMETSRRAGSVSTNGVTVMPSNQSDWARLALLRTDWGPGSDCVAIAHHERLPQLDVTAAGAPLLHGAWELELQIDGQPVELADEWSCVAWESGPDADYTELQMLGPGAMRVERLVLLSRKDRLLLFADSISGAPAGRIQLTARWPLANGVRAEADTATRSLQLRGPQVRSRAVPLALPQDRVNSTPHQFAVVDGKLELQQIAEGRGLVAPLAFDWHPQRRTSDVEWRALTVTESGQVVKGDVASGCRLRIGSAQWLFYRSLKKPRLARAVLGHHTFHETVIARFNAQGDANPLLMIES